MTGAPSGDPAVEPRSGLPTESTLFLGFGAFSTLLAVVYGVTTGRSTTGVEHTGLIALLATAAFGYFFGIFLAVTLRAIQVDADERERAVTGDGHDAEDRQYLPTASVWPIGIGFGTTLLLAGVPLGLWVMIPGLALLTHSVIGFARQSRERR